ncbi:hypothetical protein RhiirB3_453287 [Rhizophagus irregularis]|nr:hypothetical protein RhiirB3_453287 [Rhizophagus irregularis]
MFTLRYKLINATINREFASLDTNTCNDIHKHFELYKQSVLADKIFTNDEKTYVKYQLESLIPNMVVEWISI